MSRMAAKVDPRDVMVSLGLGQPQSRAFCAAVAASSLFYFAGYPKDAFREDGTIRPFAPLTPGPDGVTEKHFLVIPLAVATAVFLFT